MKEKKVKACFLELKDLNDHTGEVVFYFGAFEKDLDNETILKSAYDKTLNEGLDNVYHNRDHKEAVGKPKSFGIDEKGAYCVSQLAIKTVNGRDCYEQYKAGLIKGHSQEFQTLRDGRSEKDGSRIIKEIKLWGVTSVTNIPANLNTPIISLKSFEDAVEHLSRLNLLLKSGNISDKMGEKFLAEYDLLTSFVTKHKALILEEKSKETPVEFPLLDMNAVDNFSLKG